MNKPSELRDLLTRCVPHLANRPDTLHMFVENGAIVSTGAPSLSFEYRFELIILVTDYSDHSDTLVVPILGWLRTNQPELLMNPTLRDSGFTFRAEALNHDTADIEITLKLTERVAVAQSADHCTVTHLPEPALTEFADVVHWDLYENGELVRSWDATP